MVQDGSGATPRAKLKMEAPVTAELAVTAALREAIREGVLVPGQHIVQTEVAEQLGVSRIPLRDALRRLEAESLVTIDGRRGARVTELTPDDVAELYEIRIMLESRCIEYAIENLTEVEADRMSAAALAAEDDMLTPSEAYDLRRDFYCQLYEYSRRPRMRRVILQLRDNVDRYHRLSDRSHRHRGHQDLADAIRDRDKNRASIVLIDHLSASRDDLIEDLQRSG